MSDELNPAVIKRTQNMLGKYVKKPSLTEKLLKKPPFRFLHDVFSVVIRDTGCFVGLYTLEELTYENIKDRDDKMKFLQKMIDVVKLTTGSSLAVKTSKIVAGHEPEKTNELLQLMGEIIDNKLDWQTAVEEVKSGKSIPKESTRKSKDVTNKVPNKDNKSKEKSKEEELRTKDSKTTKTSASKITTTTNKDDKTKINTKTKPASREKTLKVSRDTEKSVKRPINEASNIKPKLIKSDSQSSHKSLVKTSTQEPKKQLKSIQNETVDLQNGDPEQQNENSKIVTPPRKLSTNSVNNELFNSKEVSINNVKDSAQLSNLENETFSAEKSKKSSAVSRKLSASKPAEGFGESINKDNNVDLEISKSLLPAQEKSEIFETETMSSAKKDSFISATTITSHDQQQIKKIYESDTLNKKQESLTSSPQKSAEKPSKSSSPTSSINEMKRESTFTRENSKESNKSSLGNRPRTSLRPPSARPPSARPGAPRRRDKNIEIVLQPNDQINMSGIQVKLETFGDLDDDGENLVIIENPNANDLATVEQLNLTESEKLMQDETLEQGHLVQQILETQKELVQQQNDASSIEKTEKDSANSSVMRQTSARQMNNLRDVIQNLTKSVNPLGKLMDFIPEDMDAMQLEFTLWRDAYIQAANELKREKSLTETATEPMKNQLVQIDANIVEYMEMINASRVKILQNSEKILKILTT